MDAKGGGQEGDQAGSLGHFGQEYKEGPRSELGEVDR